MRKYYKNVQMLIMKIFMGIVYVSAVIIPVSIFCQVIARYFFKHPIPGVEELATASFIWMVVFGSAVLFKERRHIVVDAFVSKRSEKTKKNIGSICEFLMLIIFLAIIYSCFLALPYQKFYKTVVLKINASIHTKALIVSCIFMMITSFESLIFNIFGEKKYAKENESV